MKAFLLDAVLKPFVAILFCLAFGVPFVYVGFQTARVEGMRDSEGVVDISFTRKHYWGLVQVRDQVEGVQAASLEVSRVRSNGRRRLVSGVWITSETEAVRLLAGSSNVDDAKQWEIGNRINDFIDGGEEHFSQTVRISNIFGWFGLPFLVLGVWGVAGWPVWIVRYLKDDH